MKYLTFFFSLCWLSCQSPNNTITAATPSLLDTTILPDKNNLMENNALGLEVRVRYHHDEHSRDSYSVTENYTLKGLVLTKTTRGTGRMKKPESAEVKAVSEADVRSLHQWLTNKQLLRNETKDFDIAKDAWTTSISLVINTKDTTYQLSVAGDAQEVEADVLYQEIYGAFFQMQQLFKD